MPMTALPGPSPLTRTGVWRSFGAEPSPSSPDLLLPHANTVPSALRARLNDPPAAMARTPLPAPSPDTGVGVVWSIGADPSPSCPDLLLPHANTVPWALRARLS